MIKLVIRIRVMLWEPDDVVFSGLGHSDGVLLWLCMAGEFFLVRVMVSDLYGQA